MDASDLSARRRNKAIYVDVKTKQASVEETPSSNLLTRIPASDPSSDLPLLTTKGSLPVYRNSVLLASGCCEEEDPMPCAYSIDTAVLAALESLLVYNAGINIGPTRISRAIYLFFNTVTSGYNWVQSSPDYLSGTIDGWNWDTRYPVPNTVDANDQFVWMNHLLADIMPTLVPGYSPFQLLQDEQTTLRIPAADLAAQVVRVQATGNYTAWKAAWLTWYAARQSDGNVAALTPPTTLQKPNGTQTLTVATTADNPNTFPQPEKWVPLVVGGAVKNYYTYGWGDVASTCLSPAESTAAKAAAIPFFPTTPQRVAEIADVVAITATLTDTQKATAEFWAGPPYSVTPPGLLMLQWRNLMVAENVGQTTGFPTFFYSGLALAIQLFEAGIVTWDLKRTYMQARPIQEVRRLYRGQTLTKYDGTPILGEAWIPYQPANFVTPPFADFPSGHSTYSQVFANTMRDWFGASIPVTQAITITDNNLLSRSFQGTELLPVGTFVFRQGTSDVQPGVVTAQDVTLAWSTWQEMADSAGMSRLYGGIHAMSANTGGQALGNAVYATVKARWGF